ncbi:conserved hypothetical protein [Streptomyces pristinaespiralis ATCC 25486]|uniref:DUF4184 family protein n=1 Tax=Streptomyces pristinaespiralis (strain ATCC 25486 / DSM 40338 / CBS 914.69 / JCM 4507 / KCC S-0507 / NBRC 13074 / NRRL 2958 / 5647) TaxID=457429 RepID=B5HG68_STRE2|nr:DUF4184 family protein [Streptomyces pristinaespiralis]EDY65829.2 conserved hypothetical protein [Streptomyces pristinaespiralis ATCC 25486]
MPFTISHAAAVLPVLRRNGTARGPLYASALVLGSFAPDTTYFAASVLPDAMGFGAVTHGVLGVLTVDVAITAVLVCLWLLMRDPLVALLPAARQGRVYTLLRGRPRVRPPVSAALWFYVSAVIGASTHVVWDAFTHFDRWGVRMMPVLGEAVAGFPLYTYTQYGSSAVALVALVWFTATALRRAPASPQAPVMLLGRRARLLAAGPIAVCVLAGVAHRCVRWYQYWGRIETPLDIIPTACFGAGAGLAVGLVLYATAVRVRGRGRGPVPEASEAPPLPERSVRQG